MKFSVHGLSHVGKVRTNNEDSILVDADLGCFIVCDGMGGHAAGQVASQMACQSVHRIIEENHHILERYAESASTQDRSTAATLCEVAIQTACQQIYEQSQTDPDKRGMGTTCVLLCLAGDNALLAHVGDSRAYLSRQGTVYQVTEDHSLAGEHLRRGLITPDEATKRAYRSVLTRSVGFQESTQVDVLNFELMAGDILLMCTDGLSEYLENQEFERIHEAVPLDKVPKKLVDLACKRGGHDNISCIVAKIEGKLDPESLHADKKIEVLRRIPLFQPLDYIDLIKLLNILKVKTYLPGEIIIREGQESDKLFVLISGEVEVMKRGKKLARLEPGSFFGEMGLIDQSPRSADVVSLTSTRLLTLPHARFRDMLNEEYRLSLKVVWAFCEELSKRLRITSQNMAEFHAAPDFLFEQDPDPQE